MDREVSFSSKLIQLLSPVLSTIIVMLLPLPDSIKFVVISTLSSIILLCGEKIAGIVELTPSKRAQKIVEAVSADMKMSLLPLESKMNPDFVLLISFLKAQNVSFHILCNMVISSAPLVFDGVTIAIKSTRAFDGSPEFSNVVYGLLEASDNEKIQKAWQHIVAQTPQNNILFQKRIADRKPYEILLRRSVPVMRTEFFPNKLYYKVMSFLTQNKDNLNHLEAMNTYFHGLCFSSSSALGDTTTIETKNFGKIQIRFVYDNECFGESYSNSNSNSNSEKQNSRKESPVQIERCMLISSVSDPESSSARLFLENIDSEIGDDNKEKITVFSCKKEVKDSNPIFTWEQVKRKPIKNRNTIGFTREVDTKVICAVDEFLQFRYRFEKAGISLRTGFLLFGPPGTGKSTIPYVVSSMCNFPVVVMNMGLIDTNAEFSMCVKSLNERLGDEENGIIVFDDVDKSSYFKSLLETSVNETFVKSDSSTFLQWIDSSCDANRIFFMSTNDVDFVHQLNTKMLGSLCRSGRFDNLVEVGYCDVHQIQKTFKTVFERELEQQQMEKIQEYVSKHNITIADVQKWIVKSRLEPETFLEFFTQQK